MIKAFLIATVLLLTIACDSNVQRSGILVKNEQALNEAIAGAVPGTQIIMANGQWRDLRIDFYGEGTERKPISLRAETPGQVFIEGQSHLHLGGKHLEVSGLFFRDGYAPDGGTIRFKIGKDSTAFHSRVTGCAIVDFTRPNRWENDRWVELYGKHNQFDHCYLSGKSNDGATLMVYHNGNQHTSNYHQINNNYFGPRPRKGGPRAETMRLGGSETSMTPGYVSVSNNYFEACNGEVEVISDKTNFNSFINNVFYKCEGSLVMRHGNYTTVDGNIFIGGDESEFYGGIRAVNSGHWITNNYFYKIKGEQFRSPLAIMNGIPKSPLNRYKQVTDAVVAHNTWIDCKSPLQIGVGQNKASADVLPASEIRSAPPIRTTIANNLIYNTREDQSPLVNHDDMSGILFKNNILNNNGIKFSDDQILRNASVEMRQLNDWLFIPEVEHSEELGDVFAGFEFDKIDKDLFGSSRQKTNKVGAIGDNGAAETFIINKTLYGPSWFDHLNNKSLPDTLQVSSLKGELEKGVKTSKPGDVIVLTDKDYVLNTPLSIKHEITIVGSEERGTSITYQGNANTPLFELNPKGNLKLKDLRLSGQKGRLAFAPLAVNMATSYQLSIKNCTVENFGTVLEASKGSFADSIHLQNSIIKNCDRGFVLAADQKGDYNAEMVTIKQCVFDNVGRDVIHFYRGGYDESTIGGFLTLIENEFSNCGKSEPSGVLLKTTGIINVFMMSNLFENNMVPLMASLWGAKNNMHRDNVFRNSGKIKVVEQQKQELIY